MVILYAFLAFVLFFGVIRLIKEQPTKFLDIIYTVLLLDIMIDLFANFLNSISDFFDREDKDLTDL